jgi:hypothetical protein
MDLALYVPTAPANPAGEIILATKVTVTRQAEEVTEGLEQGMIQETTTSVI